MLTDSLGLRVSAVAVSLVFFALVAWVIYTPGLTGAILFDDRVNLDGLAHIETPLDAVSFIFSGESGPLGRPLSLASFALQNEYWPTDLRPLFQANVFFHLVTSLAVFSFSFGLAHVCKLRNAEWIALLTFALWLLSPFLASAPLMLVQRMTVLSGLFVFSGLAMYVWGRLFYTQRPVVGGTLIVLGLVFGTAFAVLSKENGALLPLLALITEFTLLRRTLPIASRPLRTILWLTLGIPVALIGLYLATKIPGLLDTNSHRAFSVNERFASQPPILWEYIQHLIRPTTDSVTPFTDDRVASEGWGERSTIISTIAWFFVVGVAVVLRRGMPILLFSVLFFLSAHVLESSIINLELYYAHRNYVPAFALYFALAAVAVYAAMQKPRIVVPGIAGYLLAFATVLAFSASLWGQPMLASEMWAKNHPQSVRAHEFLANQYFSTGDAHSARQILRDGSAVDTSGTAAVLELYTCVFDEPLDISVAERVNLASTAVSSGTLGNSVGKAILELTVRIVNGYCPALSTNDSLKLIDSVVANPVYHGRIGIQSQLLNARAIISESLGDSEDAAEYVGQMYDLSKHTNHALVYAGMLAAQDRSEEALRFLEQTVADLPFHPAKRWVKRHQIDEQIEIIKGNARDVNTDSEPLRDTHFP